MSLIIKLLVTVVTLLYLTGSIFVGYTSYAPTGIMGASNSIAEQISGNFMLILSVAMVVTLVFLFLKKSRWPLYMLIALSAGIYLAFIAAYGIGAEFDQFFLLHQLILLFSLAITLVREKKAKKS